MTGGRQLALVLSGDRNDLTEQHAVSEVDHLRRALGAAAIGGIVRTAPQTNPLAGSNGMMAASEVAACINVGLGGDVADGAVLHALDGFAQRHAGVFDLDHSAVLVGTVHSLRDRPFSDAQRASAIRVVVAVRPRAGIADDDFRAGWLRAGAVNQRNHPTCRGYAQLHADPDLSRRAGLRMGIAGKPFLGLAMEGFGSADDLTVGHHWAVSPESVDGSPEPAAHLMELLGRYLDFTNALAFIAKEFPREYRAG